MRAHPSHDETQIADATRGSLDDFAAETAPKADRLIDIAAAGVPSTAQPEYMSRVDASEARRRRHSRLRRVIRAGRAARKRWSSAAILTHAWTRAHERLVSKAIARTARAARDPEADGVIIASLLAIVAVAYGSFLTATWRQPGDARPTVVAASSPAALAPDVAAPVAPVASVPDAPPPAPVSASEAVVPRRAPAAMTARTLTAIWKQRDTRSLEQAFAGLRRQTLALHRCGMRVTDGDRAVARCEGTGGQWTIDFRRSAGRWQIADVVNR